MPTSRPNIIFFFTDQQRWDTCGCYGQPLPVTPNLDRMAAQGVRFDLAFTCQPVCGPARAAIQTGRYPTEVGCHVNGCPLPLDETTIAHRLSAAGYQVGYLGKWHLASSHTEHFETIPVPPDRRGGYKDFWLASDVLEFTSHSYDGHMFDAACRQRDFPPGRYRVDAQTDWALEYLNARDPDRPFFLFLSYIEPHHQNDHGHYEGPHGSKEKFARFVPPADLADRGGNWRTEYPDYLGCIHALDAALGRLRNELTRLGLADNTLILFTSDHGSHFCTRNDEYKRACHDGCIRIPLVLHGPGFSGGQVVKHSLVSLIDTPATVLAAAGLGVPPTFAGRPLQPLLAGRPGDWPDEVFLQISESHCGRAIRTRRWKYSVRAPDRHGGQPDSDRYVEDFLYDLAADPHEQNNLVRDPSLADLRADLARTLTRRMVAVGETAPIILPAP